jgi:hypothetical protein
MKNMILKYKKMFGGLLLIVLAFSSCGQEESIGLQPQDSVAPGPVTNVIYTPTPGGAVFSYTLPADEDLLCVKAVYYRKDGVRSEAKASIYANYLEIEGFGDTSPREVKLIAVDLSRNESEAVTLTIVPLEPNILAIGESLVLKADFGGIRATWDNPNRQEISIRIMEQKEDGELIPFEAYYSSRENGEMTIRGLDTIPLNLVVLVQDKWENQSPSQSYTLTPLFEKMFEKSLFRYLDLPGDGPHNGGAAEIAHIWNDLHGGDIYGTSIGKMPQSVTFDMGVLGYINRIRLYQRTGYYIWAEGNLKNFEVYGAKELDMSGSWDSWTLLTECTSVKPSGLSGLGQHTEEDREIAENGEDFYNSSSNLSVRYIRIKVLKTWAGGTNFQISEMEFFGDDRPEH